MVMYRGGKDTLMNAPFAPRIDPAYVAWNTVASYDSYEAAQAAVSRLSEAGFPVEHLDLIGSDVRIVERVTGRMTRGRAVAAGALSGTWTGLFVGLLLSLFATGPGIAAALLTGLVIGSATGALFGLFGSAALRGKRDFTSARTIVASRYDLIARNGFVEQARSLLQPGTYASA
jgi:hypothetical protein